MVRCMTIDEHIGKRIRAKRLELKMTQEGLAELTHLSRSYIYLIEIGKKSLTISTLNRIRKVFNVSFNYFFSGSDANS